MASKDQEQAETSSDAGAEQPCASGAGCGCETQGGGVGNMKKIVLCVIVAVAAAAVVARGFMKSDKVVVADDSDTAAALQDGPPTLPAASGDGADGWGAPLKSLTSLETLAAGDTAVFLFVPAEDQKDVEAIRTTILAAAEKITLRTRGTKIALHRLAKDSENYAQIIERTPAPCVLAMVKGAGTVAVSGEITEQKLLKAYVNASRPKSSCCPPGAGCE